MDIRPFQIYVPQEILDDLSARLARTRFPDEIPGSNWDYGTNLAYLKQLVDYWQNRFDWRKRERMLNQFPQFRAEIEGTGVYSEMGAERINSHLDFAHLNSEFSAWLNGKTSANRREPR